MELRSLNPSSGRPEIVRSCRERAAPSWARLPFYCRLPLDRFKGGPGFARAFIETAPISAEDKSRLAHLNAERLLLAHA